MGLNSKQTISSVSGGYLITKKLPGCKANEKVDRYLEIDLPASDIEQGRVTWDMSECSKKKSFPERVGATC